MQTPAILAWSPADRYIIITHRGAANSIARLFDKGGIYGTA